MRAGLIAATVVTGASFGVIDEARAEPVTIWLTEQAPEEKVLGRADRQTGGTLHLWSVDLRYPPQPVTPDDEDAVKAILAAVEDGKGRWEEFEVEAGIAREIEGSFDGLTLLQNDRDRQDLIRALLFQGSAVARGFDPERFPTMDEAAGLRFVHDDVTLPKAWVDAYALSGSLASRGDLVDGTAWYHYQDVAQAIEGLPKASLEIPDGVGEVMVDGKVLAPGIAEMPPGRHYVHTVRGDVVHGRFVVELAPGEASAFPSAVSPDDLAATRERVLDGKRGGMPESVDLNAALVSEHYDGQVFLAAVDGNRVEIVGYAAGAALKDSQLVTVMLDAEIGAGAMFALGGDAGTPIFNELNDPDVVDDPGSTGTAPMATATLGVEVGISYFAIAAGVDVMTTPGRTITWANGEENRYSSVFVNPWGGLGVYAIRPTKRTATLAIFGTAGWMSPSHALYGGRLVVGIPMDGDGNFFRIALGGSYGPDTVWANPLVNDKQPLATAWLRLGWGSAL